MNNTIRWSLFGEIVNDTLDLDHLPEYISGDLMRDVKKFREMKNENINQDDLSMSELVQDVFYVVTLSEIYSWNDLADRLQYEESFQQIREDEITESLQKVDCLNRLLMDTFTVTYYEIKYRLNEIDNSIDVIEDKEEIQRYFDSVINILYNNTSDVVNLDNLRNVLVEDSSLQSLINDINEAIIQQDNNALPNYVLRIVGSWIMLPDFTIISKVELKRRLLRDTLVYEYYAAETYYYRSTLRYRARYRLPLFFNALVQDNGYMGIINEQLSVLNQEVIDVQNRICNTSFVKSKSFIKNRLLRILEDELCKYDDLKEYVIGKKCFALMQSYNNATTYFAISGLDKRDNPKGIRQVENILKQRNCHRVKLDHKTVPDIVKYHISNSSSVYLSYDDYCRYAAYLNGVGKPEKLESCGRMFSCCERKLFAKLTCNDRYVIYVRCTSCYMCKAAATYIRNFRHYRFKTVYGKHYNPVSNSARQDYDRRASKDISEINNLRNNGLI